MEATEVRRVRELLERSQFAPALAAAQKLLPQAPENRDVLYMIAVAQRYLQQVPEALATLAELERHHPGYGRLFQERGHCYVALRQAGPAIDAFLRGLVLNSSLPASWRALRELYRLTGQTAYAEDAAGHLARLEALPREIVVAFSMFADGEIYDAERVVRDYLLAHGNHVEGMRLLAQIGMKLDVVDDAELLLENVMLLAPDHHAARYEYALALLQRHKHVRAREEIQKLLDIDPDNRVYRTTHATICCGFGDYAEALPLYREILAETPQDAELHLSIGHAQKTLGHTGEAIQSYREAATTRPGFGEAYWSLANLKTYHFTDDEIAVMRAEESSPKVRPVDRYHLCFALGKALEDRGEYDSSFAYYARGNSLKRRECGYRPELLEVNARLQSEICTREFFEARRGFGSESTAPIFIVGLPRSGSTLIEQILASHSQVEGTMELADIPRLVHDLQGRTMPGAQAGPSSHPAVLGTLDAGACGRLAQKYLDDTLVYRKLDRPFFIDKMPNNFRHLSLIHLMFPRARIIDARREPMACCFSNFKQLFASGQQFTYSFEDIARYYRMYLALMAHWDTALPGKILRVQHEHLVEDVETQVRRILEFCELEFEPACLAFHATERHIHTASSEQVRRPLNRDGLEQWRHFEPWLEPLRALLAQEPV
jgi:tetratricopeptide (TPR) repeat protein